MQTKLSIIIPVYNSEKYIDRCLQSIMRQDLEDIEIICVDDGSTDNTYNILLWYQKNYSNIKVYKQSRKYAGVARNLGLSKAEGEYVHFLDADDYIYDNVYSQIYSQAVASKLDCLKFRCFCFMADSGTQKEEEYVEYSLFNVHEKFFDGRVLNPREYIDLMIRKLTCAPWSGIYRRDFLINNNIVFNDLKCVNDRSFYVSVLINAERVSLSDAVVVNHQMGRDTSLVGIRANNFDCVYKSYYIVEDIVKNTSEKIRRETLQAELMGIFYDYNNLPRDIQEKEKARFDEFIDHLDMNDIIQSKNADSNMDISQANKIAQIQSDVSGICYYNYSKLTSTGKRIEDILDKNKIDEIYVYGLGEIGRMVMSDLKLSNSDRVKGIFDKRADNNEIFAMGSKNISVKKPSEIPLDEVPILVTPARDYLDITKELIDMGINEKRIILLCDLLKLAP
ncbi:glycosyltransferase [Pseudobutyrivibrio sp. LB2011]|uniref:glycosyltransferase n=1 Tax=Pseudobutyrivibrio sp. LB2011 TaxID=1408312 RepID=UPI0006793391|nr:glycosyltransferase [Pseudobutyrivibrio sp. LB2011]